jgi:hypothetical protein
MKCDSQAPFLARTFANPCLGRKPKARVTTLMLSNEYEWVLLLFVVSGGNGWTLVVTNGLNLFSLVVNICRWIMNVKVAKNEQCTWNLFDAPPNSLIDSIVSPKVKTTEG